MLTEHSALSLHELIGIVYPELRRVARGLMLRERPDHTWQPTALVHEAIVRILNLHRVRVESADHLVSLAVRQMRRALTSYARRTIAQKRCAPLEFPELPFDSLAIDFEQMAILDQALDRLASIDPRAHDIVELRYFGACSVAETAAVLGISPVTVERDWEFARSWLFGELQ